MTDVIGIDHIYITVSDIEESERFYDRVMIETLGFRKNTFRVSGDPHIQYFNRHFGFVLRPSRVLARHEPYAPGLHHFCLRVDSVADVHSVAAQLRTAGVNATEPRLYPEYAEDYVATFFESPDGIRLEVTNYRRERKHRYSHWDQDASQLESNAARQMPIEYRQATAEDIPEVRALGEAANTMHHKAWPRIFASPSRQPSDEAHWRNGIVGPGAATFVASCESRLIAFVSVVASEVKNPLLQPGWSAKVGALYVEESFRRVGIGTSLMTLAERWGKKQGATELHLNVWCFNEDAAAFYRRLGYDVRAQTLGKSI